MLFKCEEGGLQWKVVHSSAEVNIPKPFATFEDLYKWLLNGANDLINDLDQLNSISANKLLVRMINDNPRRVAKPILRYGILKNGITFQVTIPDGATPQRMQ